MLQSIVILGLLAQPPANVIAYDTPNDEGSSITLMWERSPADSGDAILFRGYEIYRSESATGEFKSVGFVPAGATRFDDGNSEIQDGKEYYYIVRSVTDSGFEDSAVVGPVASGAQWFNSQRVNVLAIALLVSLLVIYYIRRAHAGGRLFVRKIAGLDAIEDAVGRSTEMGRPILYSFGLSYLNEVWTLASLSILYRVAQKCGEYSTRLLVPHYDPLVMSAAQETVKQAYTETGRPDLYDERDNPFLTADQFGYAAGVDGMMMREKPGAVFWQGYFYAESLILAETGHSVGAIQIAGTTSVEQIPFFVAACDYTLIGEEMYAASCYLRPEPQMLGSLKGEDLTKAMIIVFLLCGAVLGTLGILSEHFFDYRGLSVLFERIVQWFNTF
ncbi:MAG: fibronectin type III domain-containing protein [candidate division WOR-3 bacterium]|nr:MAG: fibronectin type III domain-containing protein [candidate division WOR-3 bacterium]